MFVVGQSVHLGPLVAHPAEHIHASTFQRFIGARIGIAQPGAVGVAVGEEHRRRVEQPAHRIHAEAVLAQHGAGELAHHAAIAVAKWVNPANRWGASATFIRSYFGGSCRLMNVTRPVIFQTSTKPLMS